MESHIVKTQNRFKYLSSALNLFFFFFTAASTQAQFVNAPFKSATASSFKDSNTLMPAISANKSVVFDLKNGSSVQEASIVFDQSGSDKAGFEDQTFFEEGAISISTLSSDNVALSVNSLPETEKITEINLNVNAANSQKLNLTVKDWAGVDNWGIILIDNYLNREIDLKVEQDYAFEINKDIAASYGAGRFKVTFVPPASSPIYAATQSFKTGPEFKNTKAVALTK